MFVDKTNQWLTIDITSMIALKQKKKIYMMIKRNLVKDKVSYFLSDEFPARHATAPVQLVELSHPYSQRSGLVFEIKLRQVNYMNCVKIYTLSTQSWMRLFLVYPLYWDSMEPPITVILRAYISTESQPNNYPKYFIAFNLRTRAACN